MEVVMQMMYSYSLELLAAAVGLIDRKSVV